ncbi:bifunctional RNase H/acid phosphatase [Microbulbifer aggregans]|uniref:Bifunctional RNase H/acid phosphatase n=1 Tax=Microbulbifer aggregans TaxID=1769779 RepID=A0A1C9W8L1_9GAMM|nr:histidine phosphatase family protein [Microbulbifer aggregans]AOS97478.1 bifunctional RNase H/acid phosphatase [Microbulbifer aggregans]
MPRILLIRHGEALKKPSITDPMLTPLGEEQSRQLAENLATETPVSLISSPMRRARQTAEPLAATWQRQVTIEPVVTEIPSPLELPSSERGTWIRGLLDKEWHQLDPHQLEWRLAIMDYLRGLEEDTAIFCHFMVINSVVAEVRGDSRIRQFRPDYTSITELSLEKRRLRLVRLGRCRDSNIR